MIGAVIVLVCLGIAAFAAWLVAALSYRDPITADEVYLVTTPDLWKIRLCRHKPKGGRGEPVFFCHGFMSNQFDFAHPPGESMADFFAGKGYDCWLIDLRGAKSSIPAFGRSRNDPTMDDYLLRDIPAAIAYIQKTTGCNKVHWVGYSMGGMLVYAYDAVFGSDLLASATTLGSPVGFEGMVFHRPAALLFVRGLSRGLFRAVQRLVVAVLTTFHLKLDLVPINWKNMNPRIDARALFSMLEVPPIPVTESLSTAAERHVWRVDDSSVEVYAKIKESLSVPLFAIFGADDPFVPLYTVEPFFKGLPVKDKKLLVLSHENGHSADYSHVDLVFSPKAREEVLEPVLAWLSAHPIKGRFRAADKTGGPAQETIPDGPRPWRHVESLIDADRVLAMLDDPEPTRPGATREKPGKPKGRSALKKSASAAKRSAYTKQPVAKKRVARKRSLQ
jgi:polyhydroxyalkanoate synthase